MLFLFVDELHKTRWMKSCGAQRLRHVCHKQNLDFTEFKLRIVSRREKIQRSQNRKIIVWFSSIMHHIWPDDSWNSILPGIDLVCVRSSSFSRPSRTKQRAVLGSDQLNHRLSSHRQSQFCLKSHMLDPFNTHTVNYRPEPGSGPENNMHVLWCPLLQRPQADFINRNVWKLEPLGSAGRDLNTII